LRKAIKRDLNLNLGFSESVTINLPKFVMDFLRNTQKRPIEALEYAIVNYVKAEIEYMAPQDWAELLQPKASFQTQEYIC
jgi:hypothetical protein